MNKKTFDENEIIAEFMGWTKGHPDKRWKDQWFRSKEEGWIREPTLLFHVSWEWQMLIVERIEKGNFGFKMCRKVVEIYIDDTKEVILKVKEASRQESLYKAILEFIKWYNQQEKLKT